MAEVDDMKDPRMAKYRREPLPLREVRAWRLAEQDATEGMTWEQRKAYAAEARKRTDAYLAERGLPPFKYVDSIE